MKYIIPSVLIVGLVAWFGYYLFGDSTPKESVTITSNAYGQETSTTTAVLPDTGNATTTTDSNNKKTHMITIETNYGTITFQTYDSDAPNTVTNFVTLAGKGYYDNLTFHRVIKGFMIQGGDPTGNGTGGPGYKFADELNPNTASYKAGYKKGVVAMANAGPNTNGSQFFIMTADYPLPNNYTIFGKVVSGQEVVDKIANLPTGANDRPVSPVVMKKVTVN
jgi:cyclophilin family peptidyl-prolyl cis-trans isomerase